MTCSIIASLMDTTLQRPPHTVLTSLHTPKPSRRHRPPREFALGIFDGPSHAWILTGVHHRTQTVWQTSTALTSTDFITSITTVYSATDASSTTVTTTTATATATETDTITTTVTPSVSVPLPKRLVSVGAPEPPRCMTNKCVFYSPDRITSACRCIDVPAKTVTVTATTYSITETLVCFP